MLRKELVIHCQNFDFGSLGRERRSLNRSDDFARAGLQYAMVGEPTVWVTEVVVVMAVEMMGELEEAMDVVEEGVGMPTDERGEDDLERRSGSVFTTNVGRASDSRSSTSPIPSISGYIVEVRRRKETSRRLWFLEA